MNEINLQKLLRLQVEKKAMRKKQWEEHQEHQEMLQRKAQLEVERVAGLEIQNTMKEEVEMEQSSLQVFAFNQWNIRVIMKDGDPWFVAKDVCDALELGNITESLRRLEKDEFSSTEVIDSVGRKQQIRIVNEPGLYSLISGSRKPEAKVFKRWVNHEVIPSIRKHGIYMTPAKIEQILLNPDTIIELAQQLKREQAKNKALTDKIVEDTPKVQFADAVIASPDSIPIGDLARVLKQNGIDIGRDRLFKWLRNNHYLITGGRSHNMPTQYAMDLGLFEVKFANYSKPDGSTGVGRTPLVAGKGQVYFISKFLEKQAMLEACK